MLLTFVIVIPRVSGRERPSQLDVPLCDGLVDDGLVEAEVVVAMSERRHRRAAERRTHQYAAGERHVGVCEGLLT